MVFKYELCFVAFTRPCERHKSQFLFEYHLYSISFTVSEKPLKIENLKSYFLV